MLLIKEGYGNDELRLGMTATGVLQALGKASKMQEASEGGGIYWIYDRHGIDVLLSQHEIVRSLFFKAPDAHVLLPSGIGLGSDCQDVVDAYGSPQSRGGKFLLSDGTYVEEWYSYTIGVGFHFTKNGVVSLISIFPLS